MSVLLSVLLPQVLLPEILQNASTVLLPTSCFQKHENNIVWERDGIKLRSQNMAAIARGT